MPQKPSRRDTCTHIDKTIIFYKLIWSWTSNGKFFSGTKNNTKNHAMKEKISKTMLLRRVDKRLRTFNSLSDPILCSSKGVLNRIRSTLNKIQKIYEFWSNSMKNP